MVPVEVKESCDSRTPSKPNQAGQNDCPMHKENDVILFEDPTCDSPGCVYFPKQKHANNIKRSRQSHREFSNNVHKVIVPPQRVKRIYGPLKLYNPDARHQDDKLSARDSEKPTTTFPTKSFYSATKADLQAIKIVKKRIDSSPPELVTIDDLKDSFETRSSPQRDPIITRSQSVSDSHPFLPYEIGFVCFSNYFII